MNSFPTVEAKSPGTAIACAGPSADTPRSRRVYTSQEKAEFLALFEQSGMTQAAFCHEMSLHKSTFSLWRRTAREETNVAPVTQSNAAALQFAEVQLSTPPKPASDAGATLTVRLPGGATIEATATTEAVWQGLGLLLKTLQA